MSRRLRSSLAILFFVISACERKPDYAGRLYKATAYSHSTSKNYSVGVEFEHDKAKVYFFDDQLIIPRLRDASGRLSRERNDFFVIAKGGVWIMQIDTNPGDDPKNIRLIDPKENLFLYVEITDPAFPVKR